MLDGRRRGTAAEIVRLKTGRQRMRQERAAELRQLVLEFEGLDEEAAGRIVAAIDRETANEREWPFLLINPAQHGLVVDQLTRQSQRPLVAVRLWSRLFCHLRLDTGEIAASRDELADEVGTHPNHVSAIMGELERMHAVTRLREGRRVRYFMNPLVGTGLAGVARDKAQAVAPKLQALDGGKA
jgi:hypothetical protein